MASQKKKIEFIASPTGRMGLAYHTGDVVSLPAHLADEAIKLKLAKPVKQSQTQSKKETD